MPSNFSPCPSFSPSSAIFIGPIPLIDTEAVDTDKSNYRYWYNRMYYIQYNDAADIDTTTMIIHTKVDSDNDPTWQRYNTKVSTDFDNMDNILQNAFDTVLWYIRHWYNNIDNSNKTLYRQWYNRQRYNRFDRFYHYPRLG